MIGLKEEAESKYFQKDMKLLGYIISAKGLKATYISEGGGNISFSRTKTHQPIIVFFDCIENSNVIVQVDSTLKWKRKDRWSWGIKGQEFLN